MDFKTWLLQIGKSNRTAGSYAGAVVGYMTDLAIDEGLINKSLLEITDVERFTVIANSIKQLETFQTKNSKGKSMYSCALNAYLGFLEDNSSESIQNDIQSLLQDSTIAETEKTTLINARVGQGSFRKQLIDQWAGCALTGFKDTRFLVASHIKPWRHADNRERLDPFNGLLLLPNFDKVFDLGFITFKACGDMVISTQLEQTKDLGVKTNLKVSLDDRHQDYMAYHRDKIFERFLHLF